MSRLVKGAKDVFFGGAEKEAGRTLARGAQASAAELRAAGQETRQLFQPFVGPGTQAFEEQAALSGALGAAAEQAAIGRFTESPGQRFLRERGEKTIIRNAAATGQLGGGNVLKALTEFGIGTAGQQLASRFNQLGIISGVGQQGLRSQAQGIQFGAGGGAEAGLLAAEARAGGITGRAAGIRTGIESLTSLAGAAFGLPSVGALSSGVGGLQAGPVSPFGGPQFAQFLS